MDTHLDPREGFAAIWQVQGTRLPLLRRPCPGCATHVSAASGTFRVNANGKRLDVWLLIRCAHCGHNARLKVRHRINVSSFDPGELGGYMDNDPELVAAALLDPLNARRNHYSLDWTDAWKLTTPPMRPHVDGPMRVRVHFLVPAAIRPVRIIAQGLSLSRSDVERLIADRRITSAIDLRRKTSTSFDFARLPESSGRR